MRPGFLTAKVFNLRVAWQSGEENAEKTQEFHVGIVPMNLVSRESDALTRELQETLVLWVA